MEKPNLILICALMCDERLFKHQYENLKNICNVKVVVLKDFNNIEKAADHVLNNIIPTGEFYLAGISMGGYISMEIATKAEDRIKKMCLMATTWDNESEQQRETRQKVIDEVKKTGKSVGTSSFLKKMLFNQTEEGIKLLQDMNESLGAQSFINQQELIMSKVGFEDRLKNFPKEVFVLGGAEDTVTPLKKQEDIANGLPKATLVKLKDCGHLLPLDHPVRVTSLLEYMITT